LQVAPNRTAPKPPSTSQRIQRRGRRRIGHSHRHPQRGFQAVFHRRRLRTLLTDRSAPASIFTAQKRLRSQHPDSGLGSRARERVTGSLHLPRCQRKLASADSSRPEIQRKARVFSTPTTLPHNHISKTDLFKQHRFFFSFSLPSSGGRVPSEFAPTKGSAREVTGGD